MSLAQPTLDLIMLEQISELKKTLDQLNTTILSVNQSVNEKLTLLNDKVDKQDAVIQKLLTIDLCEKKDSEQDVNIDTNKITKIEEDVNINDKNIKLNRKEIENLYRVVNTYKDENKDVIEEIKIIKTKMDVLNDSSSENSVKIMDTLNNYIIELKSSKNTSSYATVTQPRIVTTQDSKSTSDQDSTSNYHSVSNNYRRKSYNSHYNRYVDPKESEEEDGWQTVKSKKKSNSFRRY